MQKNRAVLKGAPVREYGDPPQYPIESVDNALKVVLMFADRKTVRLVDISEALGVAQSTAHRLAVMLAYRGFLRREDSSKAFQAGPALLEVGLNVVRSLDIRSAAGPVMERLARDLEETIHLVVREGSSVRFIDAVESARALRVSGRTGRLLPLHTTSVGKALLAELGDGDIRLLYPKERLEAITPGTIVSRKVLLREVAAIRERGYAFNVGESESDVGSIGMAIPAGGAATAAMSVAFPLTRSDEREMARRVAALRDAVDEIGRLLG